MRYVIAILLLLLCSCGKGHGANIEAGLESSYSKFLAEAAIHNIKLDSDRIDHLKITFGDIKQKSEIGTKVLGYCETSALGARDIVIDQDYWAKSIDLDREQLMFHELGHCLLGRKHRTDLKRTNGRPVSIMYPTILGSVTYHENESVYGDYLRELFTNMDDDLASDQD